MDEYFAGEKLYGDDFSPEQIEKWYKAEAEGYADLGSKNISNYWYGYHEMNKIHGFDKIKSTNYGHVLGFGSALGHEFEPVLSKIENITIIEPSDNLVSNRIGNILPTYVKPNVDGRLFFDDNSFDLITSFGTLHHIPNVTFVVRELIRVLKPGQYLLIREPINSMGDWTKPRPGLTKNERGIPAACFETLFMNESVEIISKEYCFTITSQLQKMTAKIFKKPIYSYRLYVLFDKYLSMLMSKNIKYHATKKIHRIAPNSIFYVIRKTNNPK